MDYETARWFADTWGLVLLAVLFLGLIAWVFRRGSTKKYEHAARIPLEVDEDIPPSALRNNDDKAETPAAKGDKP